MSWFKVEDTFFDHPKIRILARTLEIKPVLARGHLVTLWCWVVRHRPDGSLEGIDDSEVEFAAGWEGREGFFCEAMLIAGLVDQDDRGWFSIHGWMDRAISHKRATAAQKKRKEKKEVQNRDSQKIGRAHV